MHKIIITYRTFYIYKKILFQEIQAHDAYNRYTTTVQTPRVSQNPKGKTHRKKRVQYDVCKKLLLRDTLPLILANLKVNSYQCTQHIRNVECGRFCEYLSEIITLLSLQAFICPYYLWRRTILVQKYYTKCNLSSSTQHKLHYLYR